MNSTFLKSTDQAFVMSPCQNRDGSPAAAPFLFNFVDGFGFDGNAGGMAFFSQDYFTGGGGFIYFGNLNSVNLPSKIWNITWDIGGHPSYVAQDVSGIMSFQCPLFIQGQASVLTGVVSLHQKISGSGLSDTFILGPATNTYVINGSAGARYGSHGWLDDGGGFHPSNQAIIFWVGASVADLPTANFVPSSLGIVSIN